MRHVTDAIGTRHDLDKVRRRVVSLVPSTTETIFELGAEDKLVAVTRYCVRPDRARRQCATVGGTKSPRIDDILRLEPDLVLANQEENRERDVELLERSVPVFVFYPRDVDTALADIRVLGTLLDCEPRGAALASEIEALRQPVDGRTTFRYLYLIWQNPYMVAGHETFVDALLGEVGGVNAAPDGSRYPEMTLDAIAVAGADVLLLSSEPFPFTENHAARMEVGTPRLLVDGQLLSWHGARLRYAFPYLGELVTSIERARAR